MKLLLTFPVGTFPSADMLQNIISSYRGDLKSVKQMSQCANTVYSTMESWLLINSNLPLLMEDGYYQASSGGGVHIIYFLNGRQ